MLVRGTLHGMQGLFGKAQAYAFDVPLRRVAWCEDCGLSSQVQRLGASILRVVNIYPNLSLSLHTAARKALAPGFAWDDHEAQDYRIAKQTRPSQSFKARGSAAIATNSGLLNKLHMLSTASHRATQKKASWTSANIQIYCLSHRSLLDERSRRS